MARKYSGMTAREIRDSEQTSIQDASKKANVTAILDRVDEANSLADLRSAVAEFITLQTGIQ